MYTNIKLNNSIVDETFPVEKIADLLSTADQVVIGAGAGLSASAGLDYNDFSYFHQAYEPFFKRGYKNVSDAINRHWDLNEQTAKQYWGFWAYHINHAFYQQAQLETYQLLYDIIESKDYFVITTNTDGQFFKGLYRQDKIFAMQGSYGLFQCQKGCHEESYDSRQYIDDMLKSIDEASMEIKEECVPRCPVCKGLLSPNIRIDNHFVEGVHMVHSKSYADFVDRSVLSGGRIVFLELGVGFNTPEVIRYPFEQMVEVIKQSTLIRVNIDKWPLPDKLDEKGYLVTMDTHRFLEKLK